MKQKLLKLKNLRNGKIIKVGSRVTYGDEKCDVYKIEKDDIGLETLSGSASWDMIEARDIGCKFV